MKKLLVALVVGLSACTQVDTGNLGVESVLGQVKEQTLPSGVYFTPIRSIREVSGKEIAIELLDLKPKTSDNVSLEDLDVVIYYQISAQSAAKLSTRYAGDVLWSDSARAYVIGSGVVSKNAREAAYRAVAQQHSKDAHTKRESIASDTAKFLQAELNASVGPDSFTVTNVIVRNLLTDTKLENAIKQAAEVEFQIRQKRDQDRLASAEAARLKTEAEGLARANSIVAGSLTPQLLQLRQIEAMAKFAERGSSTVILPSGGATPLIQVK